MQLNPSSANTIAKELTIVAMEHSMIRATNDPEETAKNVVAFFHTVADTLSSDSEE